MRSGQLEVILNRRTAMSDELGNPEKMDEREGGQGAPARQLGIPPISARAPPKPSFASIPPKRGDLPVT